MADGNHSAAAISHVVIQNIDKEYDKAGFLDRYGQDAWFVALVVFLVSWYSFRIQLKNFFMSLRANWLEHRYNPLYMPIAGHVYKEPGQTAAEATMNNFSSAIKKVVDGMIKALMIPLTFIMSIVLALFEALMAVINAIRAMFDKIRNMLAEILQDIMGRILGVAISNQSMLTNVRDILAKATGLMAISAHVGTSGFLMTFSGALFLINQAVTVLIILAVGMIITLIAMFFEPFLIAVFAAEVVVFLVILIPVLITKTILDAVHNRHRPFFNPGKSSSPPKMPSCFSSNTKVPMAHGRSPVCIKNLRVGDITRRDGAITATMVLDGRGHDMWELGGIIVTGNHSVKNHRGKWVAARDHPDSISLPNLEKKRVYCVNTSTKRLRLGGYTFADWDDIDEDEFSELITSEAPLPPMFRAADLHNYLSVAYKPGSLVQIQDPKNKHKGCSVAIEAIKPGTRLVGGGTCVGCVTLAPSRGRPWIGHHLIVDRPTFILNGKMVPHYDHAIEQYLSEANLPLTHNFLSR